MLRLPPITEATARYIETLHSEALRDKRAAMIPRMTSEEYERFRGGDTPLIPEVRSILSRFWSPDHGPGFLNLMRRGALIARTPGAREALSREASILDFLRTLHQRGIRPGMSSDRVLQETGGQGPIELPAWEGRKYIGEVQIPQAALSGALSKSLERGVLRQPQGRFQRLPSLRHIEFSQDPASGGIPLFLKELASRLFELRRNKSLPMARLARGGHMVNFRPNPMGTPLSFLNPDPEGIEAAPTSLNPNPRRGLVESGSPARMFGFLREDVDGPGARGAAISRFLADFWKDRSNPAEAAGFYTALEADPSTARPPDTARIKTPDRKETKLMEFDEPPPPELIGDDSGERDSSWRDQASFRDRGAYRRALESYYGRVKDFPFGEAVEGRRIPKYRDTQKTYPTLPFSVTAGGDEGAEARTINLPNPKTLPDPEQVPADRARDLTTRLGSLAAAVSGNPPRLTQIPNKRPGSRKLPFLKSKEDFKAVSRMVSRKEFVESMRQIRRTQRDQKDPTTSSIEEISRSVAQAANHPKERLMESLSGEDLPSRLSRIDPSRIIVPDPKAGEERWSLIEDKSRGIPPAADRFNRPKSGRGGPKKAKRIMIDTPPTPLSDPRPQAPSPPLTRYAPAIDTVMGRMSQGPLTSEGLGLPGVYLKALAKAITRMAGSGVRGKGARKIKGQVKPQPKAAPRALAKRGAGFHGPAVPPAKTPIVQRLERLIRGLEPGRGGLHENRLADPSNPIERARRLALLMRAAGGVS